MKDKLIHYAKEMALFFIVLTLFANLLSYYKSSTINKENLPLIQAKLVDGSFITTQSKRSLIVHVWAIWCPTCRFEASNIQSISEQYDVITIAVKSGSDLEIKKFLQENDLSLKVINDNDGFLANKLSILAYPTTLIYNEKRELVFSEVGYTSSWGLYLRMWWMGL